jgi:hypothetical protein
MVTCKPVALTIEVSYESAAGLMHDYRTQLSVGGLFVQVGASGLEPLAAVTLRLCVTGAPPIDVPARLTVATAESLCVEITPETRQALATEVALACAGVDEGSIARAGVRLLGAPAPETPSSAKVTGVPLSLDRKVATMSVSEKVQMALHGNREERLLLMKDRAGVVQASIVRNPKSTLDEITALARTSHLAPDAAEAIAEHKTYGSSPQVALALARNPRTPIRTAVDLLDKLTASDLRTLAKGLGVRSQIAQAARKRLLDGER